MLSGEISIYFWKNEFRTFFLFRCDKWLLTLIISFDPHTLMKKDSIATSTEWQNMRCTKAFRDCEYSKSFQCSKIFLGFFWIFQCDVGMIGVMYDKKFIHTLSDSSFCWVWRKFLLASLSWYSMHNLSQQRIHVHKHSWVWMTFFPSFCLVLIKT